MLAKQSFTSFSRYKSGKISLVLYSDLKLVRLACKLKPSALKPYMVMSYKPYIRRLLSHTRAEIGDSEEYAEAY